jgi:hypothetical protein
MNEFGNQSKSYLSELVRLNKYNLIAFAYEKLNVSTAGVKSLTVPTDAKYADISVESSVTASVPMRFKLTGNASLPTATDGHALRDGTLFDVSGKPNLDNFRVIQTGAGTHTLHIQYYK